MQTVFIYQHIALFTQLPPCLVLQRSVQFHLSMERLLDYIIKLA